MDKFVNKDGKVILEIDDEGNEKADLEHFKDIAKKKMEEKIKEAQKESEDESTDDTEQDR